MNDEYNRHRRTTNFDHASDYYRRARRGRRLMWLRLVAWVAVGCWVAALVWWAI